MTVRAECAETTESVQEVCVSVVVPVYNEEVNLPDLHKRLVGVMQKTGKRFELIFVNDGSHDDTQRLLETYYAANPHGVQVVNFARNYGQHMAIIAGFQRARGRVVLTIDADLQNPPEEIPRVLEKFQEGFDYVGSYRLRRRDTAFRTWASWCVNRVRTWVTNVSMRDHGCMLRAYARSIVDAIVASYDSSTLVPVLAYTYAKAPTEIGIRHVSRAGDASKYTLYKLARMNFDLFTGFSMVPLQLFTLLGLCVSFLSSLLVMYLVVRRLVLGAEAEGVFTLFAILFFLVSFAITGIGLLGEYLGRAYQMLQKRPCFLVREALGGESTTGKDTQPAEHALHPHAPTEGVIQSASDATVLKSAIAPESGLASQVLHVMGKR